MAAADDTAGIPTTPPPAARPPGRHIPALDGLRGAAILMVMAFHQTILVPRTVADGLLVRAGAVCSSGVDLFFVLSGFLITGILFDAKGSDGYFRNFFARRALRIFPLYYAVLFAALVALPAFAHSKAAKWGGVAGADQAWYWLYLSNWRIGRVGFNHGILDVSWSLAIEEQFYLAWPLVVWGLGRRALIRTCAGLIVAAFACRMAAGGTVMGMHTFTTSRMDTLAAGALIALLARGEGGLGAWMAPARWAGAVAAALFLAAAWPAWGHPPGLAGRALHSATYSALVVAYGSLLVLVVGARPGSPLVRICTARPLVVFGTYSYALYLFHYPILGLIRDVAYGPGQFPTVLGSAIPGQLVFYVAATLPALGCAWLSWHLYEKHFLKLKRHFAPGRPGVAPRGATVAAARPALQGP